MSEPREDPWVEVVHRVIYGDTDAMGIVYYGTWLRFLERGRNEYLRARGGNYRQMEASGWRLPVTEVGVRYHLPGRYDDELAIATRIEEVGRVTIRFGYRVTRVGDPQLLVSGFTVHACVEAASGKARRIPPELLAWLPTL